VDPDEALKGYYLDPDVALPILQKQSASARIGVQATRQGVTGIGRTLAEELQGIGISEEEARKGFGTVASQSAFTVGKGETQTNVGLTRGTFGNAEEQAATERIAGTRVNTFRGSSDFAATKEGVRAIGSSAT
jgi:hypothetical protein